MTQTQCPISCATRCQPHEICWFRGCDDVEFLLDREQARSNVEFAAWLRSEGHDESADRYIAKVRDIETGIYGARATWSALSTIQRRTLDEVSRHGGRLERVGKKYRHRARHQSYRPVYAATIRNMCARELLAWDGGAFDPEAAAVLTERGWFVLTHGASDA